jgi:hypothetical protein
MSHDSLRNFMFGDSRGQCIVTVKDKVTGEVLFELDGHTTHISYEKSIHRAGTEVRLETGGILKEGISNVHELEEEDVECPHEWAQYLGLEFSDYICKLCGVKCGAR